MTLPASATPRTVVHTVQVEFGDCDPARIVWFPNYFRWIDAASRHFFLGCGVPPWQETEKATGLIGTPLVDTHARFMRTASFGDTLQIHVHVAEWREKSFVLRYQAMRRETDGSDALIMECEEVRVFAVQREDGKGIRAIPIPADIKALCT